MKNINDIHNVFGIYLTADKISTFQYIYIHVYFSIFLKPFFKIKLEMFIYEGDSIASYGICIDTCTCIIFFLKGSLRKKENRLNEMI